MVKLYSPSYEPPRRFHKAAYFSSRCSNKSWLNMMDATEPTVCTPDTSLCWDRVRPPLSNLDFAIVIQGGLLDLSAQLLDATWRAFWPPARSTMAVLTFRLQALVWRYLIAAVTGPVCS
jgi:hypothetical protein